MKIARNPCFIFSGKYAAACAEAATMSGCAFVNLWRDMQGAQHTNPLKTFLSDGLHLSDEGNRVAGELICAQVATMLSDDPLLPVLPPWRDVDVQNPSVTMDKTRL